MKMDAVKQKEVFYVNKCSVMIIRIIMTCLYVIKLCLLANSG